MQRKSDITIVIVFMAIAIVIFKHSIAAEITSRDQIPPPAERNVYVRYELDKTEFLIFEPIFFKSWVEVRGDEIQYISNSDYKDFIIEMADGTPIPLRQSWKKHLFLGYGGEFVPGVGDKQYKAYKPGEKTRNAFVNILDNCGEGRGGFDYYLPVGEYTLRNSDAVSDTLRFSVKEPTDPKDKEAAALLMSAVMDDSIRANPEIFFKFYRNFIKRFPNSP